MPELSFAAWTESEGLTTPTLITTTGADQAFSVEIVRSDSTTFSRSGAVFTVHEDGRFLALYDLGIRTAPQVVGTKVRSAVVSELRVNGSSTPYGRAQGYTRNASGCSQSSCSAGSILVLEADDELSVFAQRVDTAGNPSGATSRDGAHEGHFALVRLRDSWPLFRARLTADLASSSGTAALIDWDTVDTTEAGWSYDGSGSILFDYDAAGFDTPDVVYLVAFCLEGEVDSGTGRAVFETATYFADGGSALSFSYAERGYQASYVSGSTLSGIVRAACSWVGLLDGMNGEAPAHPNGQGFRFFFRHAHTTGATFKPKANKGSVQIVAIPRAELDALGYFMVRENTGGQAGDTDAAFSYDSTVRETGGGFDHNPAGDDSEIRCGEGGWVLVFARGYVAPSAARNGNRLQHRLQWRVDGVAETWAACTSYNRGTDGCDTGGHSAHGILYLDPGADLSVHLDNLGTLTDTAADFVGPVVGAVGQACAAQGILLLSQVKRPDPVPLGLEVAAVARLVTATPAPVELGLAVAQPARLVTVIPDPVPLGLEVAAVARLVTLTPSAVLLGLVVATPIRGVSFSLELHLGLVREITLRSRLQARPELAVALERVLERQAVLAPQVGLEGQLELDARLRAFLEGRLELEPASAQALQLRSQASSAAELRARLEAARAFHAELVRQLQLEGRLGRSLSTPQPVE